MTKEESLKALKDLQQKKENAVIKIADYALPGYLAYIGFTKKKLTKFDYKVMAMMGIGLIILNKEKYSKLLHKGMLKTIPQA
jgi:hypothetical protein